MRPPRLARIVANFFGLGDVPVALYPMVLLAGGRLTTEEKTFIPEIERAKAFRIARIWVAIYAATGAACCGHVSAAGDVSAFPHAMAA